MFQYYIEPALTGRRKKTVEESAMELEQSVLSLLQDVQSVLQGVQKDIHNNTLQMQV